MTRHQVRPRAPPPLLAVIVAAPLTAAAPVLTVPVRGIPASVPVAASTRPSLITGSSLGHSCGIIWGLTARGGLTTGRAVCGFSLWWILVHSPAIILLNAVKGKHQLLTLDKSRQIQEHCENALLRLQTVQHDQDSAENDNDRKAC